MVKIHISLQLAGLSLSLSLYPRSPIGVQEGPKSAEQRWNKTSPKLKYSFFVFSFIFCFDFQMEFQDLTFSGVLILKCLTVSRWIKDLDNCKWDGVIGKVWTSFCTF